MSSLSLLRTVHSLNPIYPPTLHLQAVAALEKKVDSFGKDNGIRPGVLRRYRATFALLDRDASGGLDADEIKQAFVEIGVVERTFELADWLRDLKDKGRIGDPDELSILDFVRFMREFGERAIELSGGEGEGKGEEEGTADAEAPGVGSARGGAGGGGKGAVAVARRQAPAAADY